MELACAVASLSESYPACAASISRVRVTVGELAAEAGASREQQDHVRLVVSEAVSNVVQHAYGGHEGEVHVTAVVVSGELCILVADDGRGLRSTSDSPGLGLGLVWMSQFSDGMTLLARSAGGVEVRLRFDLRRSDARGAFDSGPRVAGVC